ncbi:MAG: iron-sulfur cluster assembly protein [Hyphomonadaceae bacterium]|nr:MAG: iron-sulfur cluster assembly protein [Hyphomonadaceae bacterium]KAF0186155.1 MAG: iron-sulfur cluster assembly protein [Hyphomonadaceae bacterium]
MTEQNATHNFSITEAAKAQIENLLLSGENGKYFRLAVNGGGCSGFEYEFGFAQNANEDDIIIENGDAKVAVDLVSLPFLENAKLDWKVDLIGSTFRVINPNAKSSCGCGMSFSV